MTGSEKPHPSDVHPGIGRLWAVSKSCFKGKKEKQSSVRKLWLAACYDRTPFRFSRVDIVQKIIG